MELRIDLYKKIGDCVKVNQQISGFVCEIL